MQFLWDTHGVSNDNGASEDVKERMKQALEAKNKSASKSVPHGSAPAEGKVHDHADREGGKREFRRKSG